MFESSREKFTDLQTHLQHIAAPYRSRKSLLSFGRWIDESQLIEVHHQHRSSAKFLLFMGSNKQSKVDLQPEEAFFLVQSSLLHVTLPDTTIPLSFDELYFLWFNQRTFPLLYLHVYQYLTRIGFHLFRHRLPSTRRSIEDVRRPSTKRKREESRERDEIQCEKTIFDHEIACENERLWFPVYTNRPSSTCEPSKRLTFPDRFSPFSIDWLSDESNRKISQVTLAIFENRQSSARPSSSLIRAIDLRSHSTIYQRLLSFTPPSVPSSQSPSQLVFDVYQPRKNFRKTQPDPPDFHLYVKNARNQFDFEEIFHEQHENSVTAIVHQGELSFYSFQIFDPLKRLEKNT